MVRRTLYTDVDSTVWPAEEEYLEAEKALYGTQNFLDKWFEHRELIERYGEDFSDLFRMALDPRRVMERELYDGCAETLCNLYHSGYNLHFITHSMFAQEMREPLIEWLQREMHTGVEFDLTVIHNRFRKEKVMAKDSSAYALIDDVPKNLLRAKEAGFQVFCKAQSWNRGLDVPRFESWRELFGTIGEREPLWA